MADLCWTGGLTEGRKIAAMADTYQRPFAPHDCVGPVGFIARSTCLVQPAQHADPGKRAAFYTGWYKELVTTMPVIAAATCADGRSGPGHGIAACGVRALRPRGPPQRRITNTENLAKQGKTSMTAACRSKRRWTAPFATSSANYNRKKATGSAG